MRLVRAFMAAALVVMAVAPTAVLAQGLTMTTNFPAVVADAGATVQFPVTVSTDTPERVDLTIVSQPEGWDTSLRGAGSTVTAVSTAANPEVAVQISGTFTAEVTVPEDVAAGVSEVVRGFLGSKLPDALRGPVESALTGQNVDSAVDQAKGLIGKLF